MRESEDKLRIFAGQLEKLVAERTDELLQSQERLRALATELNLAEQRERKRIALDLHDHLQQILVLAKIKLSRRKHWAKAMPANTDRRGVPKEPPRPAEQGRGVVLWEDDEEKLFPTGVITVLAGCTNLAG